MKSLISPLCLQQSLFLCAGDLVASYGPFWLSLCVNRRTRGTLMLSSLASIHSLQRAARFLAPSIDSHFYLVLHHPESGGRRAHRGLVKFLRVWNIWRKKGRTNSVLHTDIGQSKAQAASPLHWLVDPRMMNTRSSSPRKSCSCVSNLSQGFLQVSNCAQVGASPHHHSSAGMWDELAQGNKWTCTSWGLPYGLLAVSAARTSIIVNMPGLYVPREDIPSLGSQAPSVGCGTNET